MSAQATLSGRSGHAADMPNSTRMTQLGHQIGAIWPYLTQINCLPILNCELFYGVGTKRDGSASTRVGALFLCDGPK